MIDDYLRELGTRLRLPTAERERFLAEAEDHLRESVAAGLSAGLTRTEAEDAAIFNHTAGRSFVGGAPAGTRFSAAHCQYWQSIWNVSTCARAAMLESSSDAVSLRLVAGVAGLAALGGYLVARRRSLRRLPPALTAGFFALATVGLSVLTWYRGGVPFIVPAGPGAYLSGAVVTGALTAGYGLIAWRRPAASAKIGM